MKLVELFQSSCQRILQVDFFVAEMVIWKVKERHFRKEPLENYPQKVDLKVLKLPLWTKKSIQLCGSWDTNQKMWQ